MTGHVLLSMIVFPEILSVLRSHDILSTISVRLVVHYTDMGYLLSLASTSVSDALLYAVTNDDTSDNNDRHKINKIKKRKGASQRTVASSW